MLYTVECDFINPETEASWSQFYSEDKLPKLISVTGFLTSQRFKKVQGNAPTYLAIHTITSNQVLQGEEYRTKGGGNFGQWQSDITNWHRNLYAYQGSFPSVNDSQNLIISLEPIANETLAEFIAVKNIGLDQSQAQLWLAIIDSSLAQNFIAENISIYTPITPQLNQRPV